MLSDTYLELNVFQRCILNFSLCGLGLKSLVLDAALFSVRFLLAAIN